MIDYKEFLSRHDMIFTKKPTYPFDCPFLGNGETGTLLYFTEDAPDKLYINLGNTDIYDNRTGNGRETYKERENLFLTPRLPIGGFYLKTADGFGGCDMRLSLYNGELSGTLFAENGNVTFNTYVTEGENAVVFSWQENGITADAEFVPFKAVSPRQYKLYPCSKDRSSSCYDEPKNPHCEINGDIVSHIQPKFNGGEFSVTYKTYKNGNTKTLIALIGNTENDTSSVNLDKFNSIYENLDDIKKAHDKFWNEFYNNSFFSVDDTMVEGFYWIQLYKCACATRSGKRVFDTAGPWLAASTAWPATWWNLNVELHFSLLYPSNHLEIAASLPETLKKNRKALEENVPEEYRNGEYIILGRNTTSTLATPFGVPGKNDKEIEGELGNILWALHNCYVHYSSACDDENIKGFIFEYLTNAVDFILNFTYKEDDGYYHLLPSTSPEYPGLGTDCNYSLSLLKWALKTILEIIEKYDIKCERKAVWEDYFNNLVPFPYDEKQGFKIATDIPLSMSHRHYSHLLMFYPLHVLDDKNPDDRKQIITSIDHWHSMPEGLQGYSQSGAASMFAVLGDGNRAYKHLMNLFDGFIKPNTMYHEDLNPVLETPPAAARSVLDMVMMSIGDEIRIFDGTPDCWKNIAYSDLLCENGCTVSAIRKDGKTTYVKVTAKKDCTVALKANFDDTVYRTVNLKSGETFELCGDGDKEVKEVDGNGKYFNYFGLN